MRAAAIIVAAGSSSRMGFNKLLALLGGEPVLRRTLGVFEKCPDITEIILVAGDEVRTVAETWDVPKLVCIVPGGAERHLSVKTGLDAVPSSCDLIAIHDGARPLVAVDQVTRCLRAASRLGAVTCARRITETLKRADDSGRITGSIDRENAWIMETPQVFQRDLILNAYDAVLRDAVLVTDEVSAIQHIGQTVHVVENMTPNPKITVPGDLIMAERFLG
ncbi:MAG: 2-C-methyl-D-erythritol 4-phosphate cytidylyltransferase [Verrucomicrobiaceae bacterium]|nr:2-C-methyl-D-erythritol 4-phosphate cytidylyltransferase [Verrucomicrobiaceae bacterium]